ncbi:MAG: flavodoxin [Candidatus Bipolaricaulis sp.]|nr:flavodoxin [Candidatus Bipolaricaulis sp.]MDD5219664.1 flavodoxin [Candidatus Bipolaricaulis sp.]MDD5646965.1 flavodoxin [Candidatus Bipolaricaulis sp.]
MAHVLVVYCSLSGNTKAAAEAVAAGAEAAGAHVMVKTASEAQPEDLVNCDAVALGSYDAFGYMGGGLKDFLDRAFYPTRGRVTDKPYAAFFTHGGGGEAGRSLDSLAQVFKLTRVAPVLSIQGRPTGQAVADLEELGAKLARAASSNP